jgi:hypothetical protein
MTAKRFAEITVKLWRLCQRLDKLDTDTKRRGFAVRCKSNPNLRARHVTWRRMHKTAQRLVAD